MSDVLHTPETGPAAAESETVVESIVDAVADAEGVSPLELEPPLATVVDPDALEDFVASVGRAPGDSSASVRFAYAGYAVTVTGDGDVTVDRR